MKTASDGQKLKGEGVKWSASVTYPKWSMFKLMAAILFSYLLKFRLWSVLKAESFFSCVWKLYLKIHTKKLRQSSLSKHHKTCIFTWHSDVFANRLMKVNIKTELYHNKVQTEIIWIFDFALTCSSFYLIIKVSNIRPL